MLMAINNYLMYVCLTVIAGFHVTNRSTKQASECESRKESRIRRQFGIRVAESSDTECKYGIEVARHKDTKEGGPMVLPYAHIAYRRIVCASLL